MHCCVNPVLFGLAHLWWILTPFLDTRAKHWRLRHSMSLEPQEPVPVSFFVLCCENVLWEQVACFSQLSCADHDMKKSMTTVTSFDKEPYYVSWKKQGNTNLLYWTNCPCSCNENDGSNICLTLFQSICIMLVLYYVGHLSSPFILSSPIFASSGNIFP